MHASPAERSMRVRISSINLSIYQLLCLHVSEHVFGLSTSLSLYKYRFVIFNFDMEQCAVRYQTGVKSALF